MKFTILHFQECAANIELVGWSELANPNYSLFTITAFIIVIIAIAQNHLLQRSFMAIWREKLDLISIHRVAKSASSDGKVHIACK